MHLTTILAVLAASAVGVQASPVWPSPARSEMRGARPVLSNKQLLDPKELTPTQLYNICFGIWASSQADLILANSPKAPDTEAEEIEAFKRGEENCYRRTVAEAPGAPEYRFTKAGGDRYINGYTYMRRDKIVRPVPKDAPNTNPPRPEDGQRKRNRQ